MYKYFSFTVDMKMVFSDNQKCHEKCQLFLYEDIIKLILFTGKNLNQVPHKWKIQ